jgi:hypothetical protein
MATAFQSNAFQNNAFQIDDEVVIPPNAGGDIVGGTFSRGRWRALKQERELRARAHQARRDAEQRVRKIKTKKQREEFAESIREYNAAVYAAEVAEQDDLLGGLILALEAAVNARLLSDAVAQATQVALQARAILLEIEAREQEDEELLLLLS